MPAHWVVLQALAPSMTTSLNVAPFAAGLITISPESLVVSAPLTSCTATLVMRKWVNGPLSPPM
jgi:hypothetical protein